MHADADEATRELHEIDRRHGLAVPAIEHWRGEQVKHQSGLVERTLLQQIGRIALQKEPQPLAHVVA